MPDMSDDIVDALVTLGLARADAQLAVDQDRVALALVGPLLQADRTLTVEQAAQLLGLPAEYLVARDRALGLPPDIGYSEDEVAELRPLSSLFQILSPEAVLRNMRSDAQALTRIAMSNLQLVNDEVAEPIRAEGGGDIAVALALAEAARTLLPETVPLMTSSFRRILTHLVSTEIVAAGSRGVAGDVPVAVGFVDVVGYTSLSARIDPDGLDEILEAFESLCFRVADAHGNVQLIKFLGDAAMYVGMDVTSLAATLLEIVHATEEDPALESAPMRGGMAWGPVLMRGGDYFGPPVNLAARLTDHARPGSVLADDTIRDQLSGFDTHRVPPMRLRGLGMRRPLRVRLPRDE
jgi:adenylate cyclase